MSWLSLCVCHPLTLGQAASAIETLHMSDSPVKKLDMAPTDTLKENVYLPVVGIPDLDAPAGPDASDAHSPAVDAPAAKPDEDVEPLLEENAQRFVLFPISVPFGVADVQEG